jgi:hypothetical protein
MRDGITNVLQVQLRKYMDGETRPFYYTTTQIVDSFFMLIYSDNIRRFEKMSSDAACIRHYVYSKF